MDESEPEVVLLVDDGKLAVVLAIRMKNESILLGCEDEVLMYSLPFMSILPSRLESRVHFQVEAVTIPRMHKAELLMLQSTNLDVDSLNGAPSRLCHVDTRIN